VLYVKRKEAAANGAGVELATCILAADARTEDVLGCVGRLDRQQLDGMFLQFPAPPTVEVERVIEMIPDRLDIDVTSPAAMRRYMTVPGSDPPATVAACLELLDAHGVSCRGLDGAVVAEPTPFALMLREAFVRRGVRMRRLVPPASRGMRNLLAECRLVVVSAGQPGIVSAGMLRPDTVAIDAGYFNEGGVGDIDASDGFGHLRAFAPVPGGIGPLTVSLLIERVIERAEAALT
jgi:methylenetetrahydrofolate dehydrogenase (NADP+)/methenyltetrahydrofolate cyclohydrolase